MPANRVNERGQGDFAHLVNAILEGLRAAGPEAGPGYTTADVAKRFRVGEDRVRAWIARGLLRAINTSDAGCAKPRFVIPPEALVAFEKARSAAPLPKPVRRRRPSGQTDFFPD